MLQPLLHFPFSWVQVKEFLVEQVDLPVFIQFVLLLFYSSGSDSCFVFHFILTIVVRLMAISSESDANCTDNGVQFFMSKTIIVVTKGHSRFEKFGGGKR